MEHGQTGRASCEHCAVALYAGSLSAAVSARRADGEEVLDDGGRQTVNGGDWVIPVVPSGVPKSDAAVSSDHDVIAVLKEVAHVVAGQTCNQTTVAPRARVGVECLVAGCRALVPHQSDIHRAIVFEHHLVHLCVQSRRGWGEDSVS